MRVLMLGATGTAGAATARALVAAGHDVTCLVRQADAVVPGGATRVVGPVSEAPLESVEAVVSCLASRTGTPRDAWEVDYGAHSGLLKAAMAAGVDHFVLMSAICVQKPTLAFQQAKLAFEAELSASGLRYSIVRPTAFFKSLSGQVARVRAGKPFLVFGDGVLTSCKPISDDDLGAFMAECLTHPERWDRVLPVGGPGPAITPLDQARMLGEALGVDVKVRHVPVWFFAGIVGLLRAAGPVSRGMRDKADLARIGRYYATESMLVWDPARGIYDAEATPEYGEETLAAHYARLAAGAQVDLGEHAVF